MSNLQSGPYHYFYPGRLDMPPRLCEISGNYAYFTDDSDPVRVDKLGGVFIRLVEAGLPLTVQPSAGAKKAGA